MDKKTWHVPQLVVLAQGHSEEAVLSACKAGQSGQSCPQDTGGNCLSTSACSLCYTLSPS